MIVLDASAAVSALLNDGQARRCLADEPIHAPHLVDVEVVSALRRQAGAGRLAERHARQALSAWKRIGLIRYATTPLVERMWELRDSVNAYDARATWQIPAQSWLLQPLCGSVTLCSTYGANSGQEAGPSRATARPVAQCGQKYAAAKLQIGED
ncbi:type II toxin-antitoxin system VapC family toxin [Mycolicibacterium mengxianglii]|uniref:type II toxin-antitoxin system VapC family toxin n=1 Tax=Mycolicibacterium mengxianglii TaxID=2736649 RepID=UPI0018D1A07D|nr:type II toxin-antitoxin system VapC family toxin [Mycolicibacterium mengxianglii]